MAGRSDGLQRCKLLTWHKAKPCLQNPAGLCKTKNKHIQQYITVSTESMKELDFTVCCCCVAICALRTGESRKNVGLGHRTTVGDAAASFADLSPSSTAPVCHLQRKALRRFRCRLLSSAFQNRKDCMLRLALGWHRFHYRSGFSWLCDPTGRHECHSIRAGGKLHRHFRCHRGRGAANTANMHSLSHSSGRCF